MRSLGIFRVKNELTNEEFTAFNEGTSATLWSQRKALMVAMLEPPDPLLERANDIVCKTSANPMSDMREISNCNDAQVFRKDVQVNTYFKIVLEHTHQ